MTSAQAVAFIKWLTNSKAGHAGTLDPEAAGVLPIMLGRATKICDYLMDLPKQYLAEIAFGAATDTQDAQGKIIDVGCNYPKLSELKTAVGSFLGFVQQQPPGYSALKVGGQSAYKLARAGKQLELKPREIRFDDIQIINQISESGFLIRVRCGKGAYIRTLCHDLGVLLSCPAHMRFLLREQSGGLSIDNARTAQDIMAWQENRLLTDQSLLLGAGDVLGHLHKIRLPAEKMFQAINGVSLSISGLPGADALEPGESSLLYFEQNLIGIYKRYDDHLRVAVMLYEK